MSAKHLIGSLLLLAPVALAAQDAKKTEITGEVSVEGRKVEVDPKSSKYNEYSDANNGFPLYKLGIEVMSPKGTFFDLQGDKLLRDDQSLRMSMGKFGLWSLVAERNETPHNLSFKAMTPYRNRGNGLFTLDSIAPIPNRVLAPTAAQLLANDAVTATWLLGELRPTKLGTQRDKTGATLSLTPTERLKLRLSFSDDRKEGSKLGYGVIGDRPPRSLAAQMAQPIDFKSRELRLEAEYNKPRYQAMLTYTVSKFENNIDTFRWQNPYALTNPTTATTGYDQWSGHRVATFGQTPLAPDNTYQNATFSLGMNLPWSSRLNVSAAYGKMEQDKTLLPYATSSFNGTTIDFGATASLPRQTADTGITTKRINVDYSLNPLSHLGLRAYVRFYDLNNDTPQSNWQYVTSDTMPGNAAAIVTSPTFVNQRKNLPYSYKQTLSGLEATTHVSFWRTSMGLNVEQEKVERTFREAKTTDETTLKGTFRTRPTSWIALRGKVLVANRDGGHYDYTETRASYWYDLTPVRDNNNPGTSFDNHPDMRKYDVSDRKRKELELSAVLSPVEALDISFSFRDRKDDFDSRVTAVQPLADNPLVINPADKAAWTPGNQIGLLENNSKRLAVDVSYAATERLTLNVFASRDSMDRSQRGIEFNENNRLNPTLASLNTVELGPWTRAAAQWMALSKDETDSYGLGASFEIIPGKLRFSTDYSYSNGTVDITYSGFGAQSSLIPANSLPDIHEFAFRTPPKVSNKQTSLNAHLNYQFTKNLAAGLHYAYDRYELNDWMQEANTPWFESVGSEYFLRDTSDATSNQWGNRLINLGSYLAPTYSANYVSVSVKYRF